MSQGHPKEYVDGMLVDWGAALFNQGPVTPVKASGRGTSGVLPRPRKAAAAGGVLRKGGAGHVAITAAGIRSKLGAIARRSPEVMVKITPGAAKGMRHVARQIRYISRKGEIPLEDQDGNVLLGKEALKELRDDWQHGGATIPEEPGRFRDTHHLVLSMPEGTDELALERAVRDFASREFEGHSYVMAQHTYETDPDPDPSPYAHVHLIVKAMSDDRVRLNPNKADLQRWREGFAQALNEHGVDASATKRLQRLRRERGEKLAVREIRQSGRTLERIGKTPRSAEANAAAIAKERQVYGAYRKLCSVLAGSEDVEDRKLAVQVVERLREDRLSRHIDPSEPGRSPSSRAKPNER
jgi:hypothetical protein